MESILSHEVNYHPQSFADKATRVFWWKGEIYRGISAESAVFFRKLFQDGVVERLTKKGFLIDSEITPLVFDGYDMVVRHRTIPFLSYPDEWCAAMYKQAALVSLDLAIELANWDLTLRDTHPWNVLFDVDECKPYFVDWGSIEPIRSSTWSDYELFCHFFLYPLILMSHGQERIAKLLISDEIGVLKSDLLKFTGSLSLADVILKAPLANQLNLLLEKKVQRLFSLSIKPIKRTLTIINYLSSEKLFKSEAKSKSSQNELHLKSLIGIRQKLENISFSSASVKDSDCYENYSLSFLPQENWTKKQKTIYKLITKLQPLSLLDIGCGTGWYSKLAAFLGSKVVSFDIDQTCITELYHEVIGNKLSILPLIMDFTKPTPPRGLADRAGIAATERFQCDMVLALGLVNSLVGRQCLNFEQIAEGLSLFSKKWVVVEFVPFETQDFEEWWFSQFPWYKLDNFINVLERWFRNVTVMPSHPESCVLLLCEK